MKLAWKKKKTHQGKDQMCCLFLCSLPGKLNSGSVSYSPSTSTIIIHCVHTYMSFTYTKNFDIRSEAPRSDSGGKCGILEPQ